MDVRKNLPQPSPPPKPSLNSIRAARERFGGISNESFYKLVRRGEIRITKVGGRSMVSDSEIESFIERNTADAS